MRVPSRQPSDISFGTAVITPRWLYVLAAATPARYGTPVIVDETLEPFDPSDVRRATSSGSAFTPPTRCADTSSDGSRASAARSWCSAASTRRSIPTRHASTARRTRSSTATAIVVADGARRLRSGERLRPLYDGGRVDGGSFSPRDGICCRPTRYMWGSVQTVRGCPKHCSFCSVWRTDGQKPRQRDVDAVVREIVELRRLGFRFILLADDNFYPVTLADLPWPSRAGRQSPARELKAMREERFELMAQLAELPDDMVFYTQITMEAAEDPEFLTAMRRAKIRGALVGVESVTPEGLKAVFKDFNDGRRRAGDAAAGVPAARRARARVVHLRPADRQAGHVHGDRRPGAAGRRGVRAVRHAHAVSRHHRLREVGEGERGRRGEVDGMPLTRYWLIPPSAAQDLHAAPGDVGRRDPPAHAGVWDRVLRAAADLAAVERCVQVAEGPRWRSC